MDRFYLKTFSTSLLLITFPCLVEAGPWSSQKQLESFTAINPTCGIALYLDAYGGTETSGVDTTDYQVGGASVSIHYSLNAGAGNFAECLMNYGTDVQDFSYDPYGISFWVQGTAGSTENLRVMLYEDQNLDGSTSEATDEIWYADNTTALSSGTWTQVVYPFSSFQLLSPNGGNDQLDLNRIGEWSIRAISTTGSAVSNTIHLDDMELLNTYVQPTNNSILSGSFFQLWNTTGCNCGGWSLAQWNSTAAQMKALCQNTIYVQYSIWSDGVSQYVAWYPSSLGWVTSSYSTMDNIFSAANTNGLKVVTGLYFSDSWNSASKSSAALYSGLLTQEKQVIDELYTRYGANAAFGGWYIPQEADDLQWQTGSNENLLANYYQNVAAYCKTKTSLPVMIAPFFGPNQPADVYQTWWNTLFATTTSLDAVYVQDSVGTLNCNVDVDVPNYYNALKTACITYGKTFGSTVESFTQTHGCPVDNSAFASVPASIATLRSQLWVEGSFTNNLVQFEWANMESANGAANTTLYNNYVTYQQTAAPCGSTNTATSTATQTATQTPTRTITNTATNSPTSSATKTPSSSSTSTLTSSSTSTSTATTNATSTSTSTETVTYTETSTITTTQTNTPTVTATNPSTNTSTSTETVTSSNTQTNTPSYTSTPLPTNTSTSTSSFTSTQTPTITSTQTSTPTLTETTTPTASLTNSPTPTQTAVNTVTSTNTPIPPTNTPSATPAPKTVTLYPNPATGNTTNIYVPINSPQTIQLEIFTLSMRKIQQHTYTQVIPGASLVLNLTDRAGAWLADGLYYIVATTTQGRTITKLLILR